MITKLDQIVRAVQGRGRKKLAVAYAQDSHTLEAVNAATDMGIVEAILIGDREQIVKVCMADGIDPEKFSIVDEKNDTVCVETAVRMIRDSMADVLMKGLVSTDKYMRGILNKDFGLLPPKGVLSHVAVLELPMYHKLLLVSDVAVIPYPDMNQKIRIAKYLILRNWPSSHRASRCCPAYSRRSMRRYSPKWATGDSWAMRWSTVRWRSTSRSFAKRPRPKG